MKRTCIIVTAVAAALALGQAAQDSPKDPALPSTGPASKPATSRATTQGSGKVLQFPAIQVDLAKRQIIMDAKVCMRKADTLELLVCRTDSKERESILATKAKGAHLHAALLALGLTPGIAAQWSGDADTGKALPPRGAEMSIKLRWTDKDGKAQEADASDWILTLGNKKAVQPKKWVFVGSYVTPTGVYIADHPDYGHIISVSNFRDTVIDVPFESSSSDESLDFTYNTDKIPPKETPVEVVITPIQGADKAPHARATVEIDRDGMLRLDGEPTAPSQLEAWATKFTEAHSKAQVQLRIDGRATAGDVERVKQELRVGGVRDFQDEVLLPEEDPLPRTKAQVAWAMKQWAEKFANPQDYITDPGDQADAVIKQIQGQFKAADEQKQLIEDYQSQLKKAAASYRAASQPAKKRKGTND